jgi:formate dehydrogenase subunit delta
MNPEYIDSIAPATADQVTRDANLIARNLACHGARIAAAEVADHIGRFWAPLLRTTLLEQVRAHPERFTPITVDAVAILQKADSGSVHFPILADRPAD